MNFLLIPYLRMPPQQTYPWVTLSPVKKKKDRLSINNISGGRALALPPAYIDIGRHWSVSFYTRLFTCENIRQRVGERDEENKDKQSSSNTTSSLRAHDGSIGCLKRAWQCPRWWAGRRTWNARTRAPPALLALQRCALTRPDQGRDGMQSNMHGAPLHVHLRAPSFAQRRGSNTAGERVGDIDGSVKKWTWWKEAACDTKDGQSKQAGQVLEPTYAGDHDSPRNMLTPPPPPFE